MLEEILEYHFQNRVYVLQACTHSMPELCSKIGFCCKKSAFLGDSVLDELLFWHLHTRGFNYKEFEVCRQTILKNEHLELLTIKYGFDKFRLVGSNCSIPKKFNADVFEALVAAVFLDSGRKMEVVLKVFYKFFKPSIKCLLKSMN